MEKIADTKMYPEDLNSPRREFPNEGLDIVVTLLVRPGIIFCVCFYCGSDPAVTFWQVDLIFFREFSAYTRQDTMRFAGYLISLTLHMYLIFLSLTAGLDVQYQYEI